VLETSARLLRLLSLLQTRRQWPGAELAERLETTPRTLRRDVDKLRTLGYPVFADRGVAGGYRLGPGASLPALLLDDEEAVVVAVSLRAAAGGSVTGIAETAVSALAKLDQVLPTRLRPRVAALADATVSLPGYASAVDARLLTTIAVACRDSVRLRFGYTDHKGVATRRIVEPHRLVHTGPRWYLVARDLDRGAWHTFRVDRLSDPLVTGVRFVAQDPPDAAAFVAAAVTTSPYRHRARVLFHAPAEEVGQLVRPTIGVLEPAGEGECVLTTGADSLDVLAVHLGMLPFEFTVEDPPELRERLRAIAERFGRSLARTP
jgi:predicted DNA-binding transcriptional regulator YafY